MENGKIGAKAMEGKVDEETIRWLRDELREEGDTVMVATCERALTGDAAAIAAVEETVTARVARAHREHRSF